MFEKTFLELLDYSNAWWITLFTVCAVVLCLFAARNMMALRIHGEEFVVPASVHHLMKPRIPQMNMMKVHIPFTFRLLETSTSSYSELQCSMSSQIPYEVHAYWGVNIKDLHIFLWRPWADIRNACTAGEFLKGYYEYLGVHLKRNPHRDQVMTLNFTGHAPLDLGTPPRLRYPLVIFLIRSDADGKLHPDDTVALINVVHVKDSVCTLSTSILGQYLKQANGQLSCLKQLYLATGNSDNYETQIPLAVAEPVEGGPSSVGSFCPPNNTDDSTFWNSSGEQLCVVCQTFPLSRALLPCRHTCICASCFNKLQKCPMCRSRIKSYFCIRGEEYLDPKEPKNEDRGGPAVARRRWFNGINWDDRLIDFLGFSR
ncbi:cell growth regulator with RING finger domain protein 1-like [Anthonomus grandis grandis]|uniref:cell growth regulator with RING finger domain protein 1-like n=1 Tax=Anthonomus grandis grandis TaxID=2921223 RepID=UPI0021662A61|nr:cell growth regulator with RING finger domain protein 1-like [Anthonomus grandis grandis]